MVRNQAKERAGRRPMRWAGIAALLAPGAALADRSWNLQPPVTPIAQQQYDLHLFIFWICVVIGVVVFGAMAVAMVPLANAAGRIGWGWGFDRFGGFHQHLAERGVSVDPMAGVSVG